MNFLSNSYSSIQEPLYRVETGNYEYRLVLRCRQEARAKFARLRNDVLEKIELLEAKHSESLASNLKKLLEGFAKFNQEAIAKFEMTKGLFPIEVDLKSDAFTYKSQNTFSSDGTEEEEIPQAEEAKEVKASTVLPALSNDDSLNLDLMSLMTSPMAENGSSSQLFSVTDIGMPQNNLLPGFQNIVLNQPEHSANDLLTELGLDDIDLTPGIIDNSKAHTIDDLLN